MAQLVACRCPECRHIRGEAGDGSEVRLQCNQCKIKFVGIVRAGKFHVTNTLRRQMQSAGPPRYIG